MTIPEFNRAFEAAIAAEPNSIKGDEPLSDLPSWDSMAAVAVLAMADDAGITIEASDLRQCKTVTDIRQLFRGVIN